MSRGSVVTPSKSDVLGERVAAVLTDLAAAHRHPSEAQLVQHDVAEDVRVAGDEIARPRRQRAAEPRDQRLLKRAGAERLRFVGVERTEAGEEPIGSGELVVEAHAELIQVAVLFLDRREVLRVAADEVGRRHVLQQRRGNRIDASGRNLIVGERRARPGRRNRQRVADRRQARRSCRRARRRSAPKTSA